MKKGLEGRLPIPRQRQKLKPQLPIETKHTEKRNKTVVDQDIDNFLTEYYRLYQVRTGNEPKVCAGADRMHVMDMIQSHPTFTMPKYKTLLQLFFDDRNSMNVGNKWPITFFCRAIDSLEWQRKKLG